MFTRYFKYLVNTFESSGSPLALCDYWSESDGAFRLTAGLRRIEGPTEDMLNHQPNCLWLD